MLRTIRVIIDIGMHLGAAIPADSGFHPGERWTPALAAEFMAAYNGSPAEMRSSEIDRYLGWPGQAIGYKLGERAWREAGRRPERRLGAAFDLKSWHMKALSQGPSAWTTWPRSSPPSDAAPEPGPGSPAQGGTGAVVSRVLYRG